MPDQTLSPRSGTDGLVKTASGDVVLAGIQYWHRDSDVKIIPVPNFLSPADTLSSPTTQPNQLKGIGYNTVQLKGIYNTDGSDSTETGSTGLYRGAYVALDLLISRTASRGYPNVIGWVSDFNLKDVSDDSQVTFTCTVKVDGPFPSYGAVN